MTAKKKTASKKGVPRVKVPPVPKVPPVAKVPSKSAGKKVGKKAVSEKVATRQGSKWTVREVETQNKQMLKLLTIGFTIAEACEVVGISTATWEGRVRASKEFKETVQKMKSKIKDEEDSVRKQLVQYINKQVQKDIKKGEKVTQIMKWWLNRADKIQKQKEDREERRERAAVEDGFRERQLQIQEMQNNIEDKKAKAALMEASARKHWHDTLSERRGGQMWTARKVVARKLAEGIPPEQIAIFCERKQAKLAVVAVKHTEHLKDKKKQLTPFIFGTHGTTEDEVENADVWQEMANKVRENPEQFKGG